MTEISLREYIGRTGLQITRVISWDEAQAFTASIDDLESGLQFGIGDWLEYCEQTFGENYAQLIPEGKESSWLVYKWVASRVKNRSGKLSWTHHRVVAGLLTERQEVYLRMAEEQSLSASALNKLIKEGKEQKVTMITCPLCGGAFEKGKKL